MNCYLNRNLHNSAIEQTKERHSHGLVQTREAFEISIIQGNELQLYKIRISSRSCRLAISQFHSSKCFFSNVEIVTEMGEST